MQTITLYRYTRSDGGVSVSTEKPDVDYVETFRLIADEFKRLTDGTILTPCVDTDEPSIWYEVDYVESEPTPEPTPEPEPDARPDGFGSSAYMAELKEKAAAYDILMGVGR